MRRTLLMILVSLTTVIAFAGLTMAHGEDDPDYDDHHDDMMGSWGAFPFWGMGMIGYLVLAFPIALLVYMDARERNTNAPLWAIGVLVPWFGLLVVLVYLVSRGGMMRLDRGVHDRPPGYGGPYVPPPPRYPPEVR